MRNLLALIGAAVVLFVGLGWYLGWYTFAFQPGSDGKQRIQLDVDTHKIADDAKAAAENVGKTVDSVREKADQPKPAATELVGPPPPPDLPAKPSAPTVQFPVTLPGRGTGRD